MKTKHWRPALWVLIVFVLHQNVWNWTNAGMDRVIAVMFIIVLIGLLADKTLFSPLERFFHRRCGTARA